MISDTTLDDLILQYSENPFIDNGADASANKTSAERKTLLGRLLMQASRFTTVKKEEIKRTFQRIAKK